MIFAHSVLTLWTVEPVEIVRMRMIAHETAALKFDRLVGKGRHEPLAYRMVERR